MIVLPSVARIDAVETFAVQPVLRIVGQGITAGLEVDPFAEAAAPPSDEKARLSGAGAARSVTKPCGPPGLGSRLGQ